VDHPTECKLAYLAVVSHPAGETVAHLIDKFLQRRFAQRLLVRTAGAVMPSATFRSVERLVSGGTGSSLL
jgi:hypothetical protein